MAMEKEFQEVSRRSFIKRTAMGGAGLVVAALNVGCHAQRINIRELQSAFLPRLRQAALEIGSLL